MKPSIKTIGIYGYGRFGQFWADQLKQDFEVWVYNHRDKSDLAKKNGVTWQSKAKILQADVLILCVPISRFQAVLADIGPRLKPGTILMDTCSVKEMPARAMLKHTPAEVEIMATHPMFGPDSGRDGIAGLPLVYYPVRCQSATAKFWEEYWRSLGLDLIRLTSKEHDKKAAYSQGVAHYLARVLADMKLERTEIDVKGFSALMDMKEVLTNDTWQLFNDLQQHNRYTKQMRIDFLSSMKKIYYRLFPPQVKHGQLIIGIQGDRGSYNEIACREYCAKHGIEDYQIKYLINSKPVLRALYRGDIDHGVIAIQNAQGGVVMESVHALTEYNAKVHEIFGIVINHCVLVRPGTTRVKRIVSHEQALKQCRDNLSRLYSEAIIEPYKDTALAARKLADNEFPAGTAVIAPATSAGLYGLQILQKGIQDLGAKNVTDFLFISNRL